MNGNIRPMNKKIFKRHELKYIITNDQMNELISLFSNYLNEDKYFRSTISNIYYDTPNFYLIRNSIEKPQYKEKIRIRGYNNINNEDLVFVEVKKKYNGVVYKRRESIPYISARLFFDQKVRPNDLQITKEIEYSINYYQNLKPTIFLSYERIAYIGKEDENFRITFDKNIIWRDYDVCLTKGAYGNLLLPQNLVLLEVKTLYGLPRWLLDFFGKNNIYKQSYSKYGNVYKEIVSKEQKEKKYA